MVSGYTFRRGIEPYPQDAADRIVRKLAIFKDADAVHRKEDYLLVLVLLLTTIATQDMIRPTP